MNDWLVFKFTSPARAGVPDLVAIRDAQTVWLEIKTPRGRLSDIQVKTIGEMRNQGAHVYVIDNLEHAEAIAVHGPDRPPAGGD